MQVLSVNVGLPRDHAWQGRTVRTAIFKEPTAEATRVESLGLVGDGQADLRVHGGPDKAVYAYAWEHYAYWADLLPAGAPANPGAFGENLTTRGLLEPQVRIGDEYQLGTAVLRAVQPRQPCYKLNLRFNDTRMVPRFIGAGRSGIYFQVLRPGRVQAGDAIQLVQPSPYRPTIQDVADLLHNTRRDPALVEELLGIPYLPPALRIYFQQSFDARP
jgi:MOSC domain-containing protein YiiM